MHGPLTAGCLFNLAIWGRIDNMILSTVIVVLLALLFSAFFSGMEIAFLASNKLKLEIEKSRSHAFAYIAGLFSRHPGQYITTILVGNNIALVIYSLQMSLLIQTLLSLTGWGLLSRRSFLLGVVLSTVIMFLPRIYIPKPSCGSIPICTTVPSPCRFSCFTCCFYPWRISPLSFRR